MKERGHSHRAQNIEHKTRATTATRETIGNKAIE